MMELIGMFNEAVITILAVVLLVGFIIKPKK